MLIQILAQEMLEHGEFDHAIRFRDANGCAEVSDCFRIVAAAPYAGKSGHTRIVPATDVALFHQLEQLALAQQRICEI